MEVEEEEEEEGEGIRIRHLNKNAGSKSSEQPGKHIISPHTAFTRCTPHPHPPLSLEDDCSDVCFHSFLTTLSLIEVSAPGSGVSARSGRSDYNMSVAVEMLCFQVRSL